MPNFKRQLSEAIARLDAVQQTPAELHAILQETAEETVRVLDEHGYDVTVDSVEQLIEDLESLLQSDRLDEALKALAHPLLRRLKRGVAALGIAAALHGGSARASNADDAFADMDRAIAANRTSQQAPAPSKPAETARSSETKKAPSSETKKVAAPKPQAAAPMKAKSDPFAAMDSTISAEKKARGLKPGQELGVVHQSMRTVKR